ncbi:MAG: SLAP domain-containing protein [Lactobacillus panisapium]
MKQKVKYLIVAALCAISFGPSSQLNSVHAASHSISKTIMHDAQAYSKEGKKVKGKCHAYSKVILDDQPIIIGTEPHAPYYKVKNKKQYLKANNIDGVKRKVNHNSYVYASGTRKAEPKVIKAGSTVTTYGGAYQFKNGLLYYRIGGPKKQYIKAQNLGAITGSSTEETTVTVTNTVGTDIYDNDGATILKKRIKKGTKFKVDRCEEGSRADAIEDIIGQFVPNAVIYRIKGTKHWLWGLAVKANKKLPVHDYNAENFSYIRFNQDINVYNADGTMQDHHGQKIRKQGGRFKVDKLLYLWVPAENKTELFYHLKGHQFYATQPEVSEKIDVGDAYVKKNEVEFFLGINLKPSNTAQDAKNIITVTTYVKAVPKLRNIHALYDNNKNQVKLTGEANGLKKVKIFYNKQNVKTAKVNKSGNFAANLKFKGYKNFTLYGINKASKKATTKVKLTSKDYAAPVPCAVKGNRTKESVTYEIATNKGCTLNFYYNNHKMYAVTADSEKTQIVFPAGLLKGKTGHFTIRQDQTGKKISQSAKVAIPKVGYAFEVNSNKR